MKTFKEYLQETPLPDSWDKEVFKPKVPFKKQIEYAVERSVKLGKGSARIALEIMYQNRPTVLKIAHNKKGLSQNEAEVDILTDSFAKNNDMLIPIIDYDKENEIPIWIHVEKAEKATEKKLCELIRTPSLRALIAIANNKIDGEFQRATDSFKRDVQKFNNNDETKNEVFYEYVDTLVDLATSFDVNLNDFGTYKNWGIYKGKPVVIDIGFTQDVSKEFYK